MSHEQLTLNFQPYQPLVGKKIAITGDLSGMTRAQAVLKIHALGGRYVTNVSRYTDILLRDSFSMSTKSKNAAYWGTRIMSANELFS